MPTATLRSVGGSVVMAIPKRILELVQLQAGSRVDIDVRQGQLVVIPQRKKRYTLSELLAQCDSSVPLTVEDREWLDAPAVGLEDGAEGP
ncbi:MAG: antitoxin [Candidatus Contendobacter sp.]